MKEITYTGLRKFNFKMGILHLVQAILMLVLSFTWEKIINFKPTIWSYFLKFNPITSALETSPIALFDLPFGLLVASFLLISAIAHFVISMPKKTNDI